MTSAQAANRASNLILIYLALEMRIFRANRQQTHALFLFFKLISSAMPPEIFSRQLGKQKARQLRGGHKYAAAVAEDGKHLRACCQLIIEQRARTKARV